MQPERQLLGRGGRLTAQHAGLNHPGQHRVTALGGHRWIGERVIAGGVLHHPGQQRGLGQGEVRGRRAEVRFCRYFDPVGEVAEVGVVQVAGEDLLLGLLVGDRDGEPQLVQLSGHCVLVGRLSLLQVGSRQDQHVLDVLLGDTGTTLHGLVLQVVDERTQGALEVQGAFLPEPVVLDRHDRLPHDR